MKGDVEVKEKKLPKEKKNDQIKSYVKEYETKKFKVYDGNEKKIWKRVKKFWLEFKGKALKEKSKSFPKKDEIKTDFYSISTTGKRKIFNQSELNSQIKGFKWDSNFQLKKNTFKYIRLYVGYEDLDDPTEYTIFIRYMELKETEEVIKFLNEN